MLREALARAEAALHAVSGVVWGLPADSTSATTHTRVWNQPFTTNTTLIRKVLYDVGQAIEDLVRVRRLHTMSE